jgi:hypothetical protein
MNNVIDFEKRRLRGGMVTQSPRTDGEGRQEPIGDIVKRIMARIEMGRSR